jgi:hypothetical protein
LWTGASIASEKSIVDPVPVEMWRTGDDALTQWFWRDVVSAFDKTDSFTHYGSHNDETLVVTLTENVDWKIFDGKQMIEYVIKFEYRSSTLLTRGQCWEDRLSDCTNKVIGDAIDFVTHGQNGDTPRQRHQ